MARAPEIRDEDILEAARAVFLERGVDATTAEVARRAHVSEGSIFNRFKTKDDLFRAAMVTKLDSSPWMLELDGRVGKGRIRDQLIEIAMQAIALFREVLPIGMMNWSNRKACMDLPAGAEPPPARALSRMAKHFEAEMRLGRIRRADPEVVARSFVGALVALVFLEITWAGRASVGELLGSGRDGMLDFVKGHVDLLLSGLQPKSSAREPMTYPTHHEQPPLIVRSAEHARSRSRR